MAAGLNRNSSHAKSDFMAGDANAELDYKSYAAEDHNYSQLMRNSSDLSIEFIEPSNPKTVTEYQFYSGCKKRHALGAMDLEN